MAYLQVSLYSNVLARAVSVNIVLPEHAPGERVPALYLLHGMTDDESCWQRRTSIERYADDAGVAVIMPDGMLSWYCDTPYDENYFQFVSSELLTLTRRMLPALSRERKTTFVGGLSMGGFGAMKCALNAPESFSAVVCLSGALDPMGFPEKIDPDTANGFDWEEPFGPLEQIPGTVNDLCYRAEQLKNEKPRVYMWCGTDDSLISMSRAMADKLRELNYSMYYHETPGGHEWPMWDREICAAMDFLNGKGEWACH